MNSDSRAFARTVEPWPGPRPSPRPRARTRWRGTRHTSGRRVRSRGAHEDRSTGAPEAGCPGPTVKPDARISRRDGRDARPCPRTRHTPRRTGTAHVCQHPTTSPAPATLRHFRVVSFEAHFDWLFLFFEALTVLLLARLGTPWLRETRRHSAPCIPCQQYSTIRAGSSSPPSLSSLQCRCTNDAPCVPVMPGS